MTRAVHALRPADPEIAGLPALMLLTEARRPARTTTSGELVELADQDRGLWDHALVGEGLRILVAARASGMVGGYQLQASIAAVHTGEPTDWPQILSLYDLLLRLDDSPVVALNRVVAVAMVRGPEAGLAAGLAAVEEVAPALQDHFRIDAVRGHLHAMRGDRAAATRHFTAAAARTTNLPEQRHLTLQAARMNAPADRSRF